MDERLGGSQLSADWSRRWEALINAGDPRAQRRIAQGRAYRRSGRVTELRVRVGGLTGRVQGSHAKPQLVEIDIPALPDDDWARIVDVLARQVRHYARLLAGQAPEGLDDELSALNLHLLPTAEELRTSCSCGDAVWPCEHLAAVWADVSDRLDDDPFLLLRVRGRGKARLLAELAAARRREGVEDQLTGLDPTGLDTAGWSVARAPLEDVVLPADSPPSTPAGTLRMLGDPPGWEGRMSAWDLLHPLVQAGASYARQAAGDEEG